MPKPILLLLLVVSGLLFFSPVLFAQRAPVPETTAHQVARLKYRYEIEDSDGVSELIEPLFNQLVGEEKSSLDLPQKHLIAMAAIKFYWNSGDHSRAILPFLIALHLETELKKQPHYLLLVEPVDKTKEFRTKYLPALFFNEEDRSHFRRQFDDAVNNGACVKTELSDFYYEADSNQLSPTQQKLLDTISLVKENPQPTDREIDDLMNCYFTQFLTHRALANESTKTAIEGLMKLNRTAEANRLKRMFQRRHCYLWNMNE